MILTLATSVTGLLALLQGGDRYGYDLLVLDPPVPGISVARGLSGTGVTAGYYVDGSGGSACIWDEGVIQIIGGKDAHAVNRNGVVVGVDGSSGFSRPFRYSLQSGTFELLQGLVSGAGSALDVNVHGVVVGLTLDAPFGGSAQATAWDASGTPTALGTLGGSGSAASAINDRGLIVGVTYHPAARPFVHPGLGTNGAMQALRLLSGDTVGYANDVNEAGLIVGTSVGAKSTAVSWHDGHVHPLPVDRSLSTSAFAVNDRGDIVGSFGPWALLTNGVVHPLTDLASVPSTWVYDTIEDLDDAGRICGLGSTAADIRGWVLTPKRANLNRDATLDRDDVRLFASAFARSDALADLDGDGSVTWSDVAAFSKAYRDG